MTITTADALCRYFESLYHLNQTLIALCGTDMFDYQGKQERQIDDVVMSIPRLVPYIFNRKAQTYEISKKDGLMRFSDDIPFLKEDYESILLKHLDCLEKVKKIRNKLEHEMHGANIVASVSGSMFSVSYEVIWEDTEVIIDLCASEIIAFVKDMNMLFSKIQKLVTPSAIEHHYEDHPYHRRLVRYDFRNFNKIFESDLLQIFSNALLPF